MFRRMYDYLTDNKLLLSVVHWVYFLLNVTLSVRLLRHYEVRPKLLLGLLLALWAVMNIKDFVLHLIFGVTSSQSIEWIMVLDQLLVPFCAMFIMEVLNPRSTTWLKCALYLSPFVVLIAAYVWTYSSMVLNLIVLVTVFYAIGLGATCYYYRRKVDEHNRKVAFLSYVSLVAICIVWLFSCVQPCIANDILYFVVSGLLWCLVTYAVENVYPVEASAEKATDDDRLNVVEDQVSAGDVATDSYPFAEKLEHLMTERRLYLDAAISEAELARLVGTNRSYLSEYFNKVCLTSFTDYINAFRVQHAERFMAENPQVSLEEVAVNSGFNSTSTFRRVFTKKHGVTPSIYRQSLSKRP